MSPLTPTESRDLRALAGVMIPASTAYKVPGADDDLILADILKSLERDTDEVRAALKQLSALSGGAFADLAPDRRRDVAAAFQKGGAPLRAQPRGVVATTATTGNALARPSRARRSRGMPSSRATGPCSTRNARRCIGAQRRLLRPDSGRDLAALPPGDVASPSC